MTVAVVKDLVTDMSAGVQRPSDVGRDNPQLCGPPSRVDGLPRMS